MDKYTSSQPLLPHSSLPERSSSKKSLALLLSLFALLALLVPSPLNPLNASLSSWTASPATLKNTCGQAEAIIPDVGVHDIASVWKEKDRIISWHQGAIRVPTQVYDEMGEPGEDHRWDIFQELHDCR
jgi:Gly-Xaa carboxypeptidase